MKDKRDKIGIRYAIQGLIAVTKSEANFRFHLLATVIVIGLGFLFQLTVTEWMALVIVIGFVLVTEVFNTVVEKMIDYLKPEYHQTAGFIKDAAAGAVLITAIISVIVGLIVFIPKISGLF